MGKVDGKDGYRKCEKHNADERPDCLVAVGGKGNTGCHLTEKYGDRHERSAHQQCFRHAITCTTKDDGQQYQRYSPIDGKRYDTFHNGTKVYIFPHAKALVGRTNPDIGGFNLSRKAFNW
jgi:hypothetical protein